MAATVVPAMMPPEVEFLGEAAAAAAGVSVSEGDVTADGVGGSSSPGFADGVDEAGGTVSTAAVVVVVVVVVAAWVAVVGVVLVAVLVFVFVLDDTDVLEV